MKVIGVKRQSSAAFAKDDNHHVLTFFPSEDNKTEEECDTKFRVVYEKLKLNHLCPVSEICAEKFLTNLLESRGYQFERSPAIESPYKRTIKQEEMLSYSTNLIDAISNNNVEAIQERYDNKKRILACNRFGESTLHLAARKAHPRIVYMIFKSEVEAPLIIDDFGRSPLTDALWAISPSFAVIEQLLDYEIDLLFLSDIRGFTPLNYVRKEHMFKVCLFFYSRREKYWPDKGQDQGQDQDCKMIKMAK